MGLGRFVWMTVPEKVLLYGYIRMFYTWAPMLSESWDISRDEMSLILTVGEIAAIGGGFVTPLADRVGNRIIAVIAWIIATLCAGMTLIPPSFASIMVLRLTFSFMAIVFIVCAQSAVITCLDGKEQNGMATGLSETSWSLSSLALIPLLAILYDHVNWVAAFAVFVGLMVLFTIEVVFYFPVDKRLAQIQDSSFHDHALDNMSLWNRIKITSYFRVLRDSTAMIFNLSSLVFNVAHNAVFVCFTYWAVDQYNVDVEQMALVGFLLGLAELIGSALVMLLADRYGMHACMYVSCFVFLAFVIAFQFSANVSLELGVAMFCLLYIPGDFLLVTQIAAAERYVSSSLRSTMLGLNFQSHFAGRAIGAGISTWLWAQGGLLGVGILGISCSILTALLVFVAHRKLRLNKMDNVSESHDRLDLETENVITMNTSQVSATS